MICDITNCLEANPGQTFSKHKQCKNLRIDFTENKLRYDKI